MYDRYHVDRNEEIETVKELIKNRDYYKENSQKGISILINGSWGSGKTTFINDLCKNIELEDNYEIIKYDSFEYDFYDNPYIPLFSFLHEQLKVSIDIDRLTRITSKQIGKMMLNTSFTIIKTLFKSKIGIDLDDFNSQLKDIKKSFDEENNVYNEFKELKKIKQEIKDNIYSKAKDKPIIFIIDELDRCNPSFAIGTLEILKYFLDTENFIIILSLDEKQLQESVKTIYGQGMNSDIYFSKFFDYKFNLSKLTFSKLLVQDSIKNMPDIITSIDRIINILNISVRDGHKIFIEFLRKYDIYNKEESLWTKQQSIFIFFMITLKNIDLMFYNSIINCNFSNYKSVLEKNDNIDKKKYFKLLKFSISSEKRVEECISLLNQYSDRKYIDVKNLNIVDSSAPNKIKEERRILKEMYFFLPQVKEEKSYMDNLLEILNK